MAKAGRKPFWWVVIVGTAVGVLGAVYTAATVITGKEDVASHKEDVLRLEDQHLSKREFEMFREGDQQIQAMQMKATEKVVDRLEAMQKEQIDHERGGH